MHDLFDPRFPQKNNESENADRKLIPDEEGELTEEDFDFEGEEESLYEDFDLGIDQ